MARRLVVVASEGPVRSLAVARLAAERVERGSAALWLTTRRLVRPLAWLGVTESRWESAPIRPGFVDRPWPSVNPFDLSPTLAALWLGAAAGPASVGAECFRELLGWVRACQSEGTQALAVWADRIVGSQASWSRGLADEVRTGRNALWRACADETEIPRPLRTMNVVSVAPADMRARHADALLLVFALIDALVCDARPVRPVIVLDGGLEQWPRAAQAALVGALRWASNRGLADVIVASDRVVEWPTRRQRQWTRDGAGLAVGGGEALLPSCWGPPPHREAWIEPEPTGVLVRRAHTWLWAPVPSPAS